MNPNQAYYSSSSNPGPGRGRRILIVAGLFILVVGAIAYFIMSNRSSSNGTEEPDKTTTQNSSQKLQLTTSAPFSFQKPSDMKGYIERTGFTINIGDFTTTDNACNIQFGIAPAGELPGDTPEEIATAHLGANSVPTKGKDLVLKSASDDGQYAMPTLSFDYAKDGVYYKASYSVVVLKQNKRAFVRRYCASSNPVSDSQLAKVDKKAAEITIKLDSEN